MIAIVGPTASGKSFLAMKLADEMGGEIICADSRTIYREMDIGTAKPTHDDRSQIIHYGLDLIIPTQRYSAAEFQQMAYDAARRISSHNKVPFVVGGTGLYVYAAKCSCRLTKAF